MKFPESEIKELAKSLQVETKRQTEISCSYAGDLWADGMLMLDGHFNAHDIARALLTKIHQLGYRKIPANVR